MTSTEITIAIIAAIGVGLYIRARAWHRAITGSEERVDMAGLRKFQEELGRLKNETTRESEEFKRLKEQYSEKYRNRRLNVVPTDDDSGSGKQ
jgi:hypothetical protein